MSLTFYYAPRSTASITALVLEELGTPHEVVKVNFKTGDTKKPDFLKLNPNAKVPVLGHDGAVIWESAAITLYLGETFGVDKNLFPAAGPQRGDAMKWVAWTNVTLGDACGRFARNTMSWIPAEQHNAKAAEAAMVEVNECLRILDEHLAKQPYLLGSFTIVDAHVNSLVDWLRMSKVDCAAYPNMNAWSARCSERPAYKKVMAAS